MRAPISQWAKLALSLLAASGIEKADAQPLTGQDSDSPFIDIVAGSPFTAQGNEPSWALTFAKPRLLFVTELGSRQQTWLLPLTASYAGGQIFSNSDKSAQLTVTQLICRDTMTGMPYPTSVIFSTGRRSWQGCGGNPLSFLTGKSWRVIALDERPLQGSSAIWLTIRSSGEVTGSTGCFRFRSMLVANGEGIRFNSMSTSWPTCKPARMHQAYRFITGLSHARRFDFNESGALLLYGDGQFIIKALRLPADG